MTKFNIGHLFTGSTQLGPRPKPKSVMDKKTIAELSDTLEALAGMYEEKSIVRRVRDTEYWGAPYGTIITPGMIAARATSRRVPNSPTVRISPRDKFNPLKAKARTYKTDDASRMKNLSPGLQEELRESLSREYGVDEFEMRDNLRALYERATGSGAVEAGMRWYEDGGNFAAVYAKSYGLTREQGTATVAALSPLREWEDNIALAQYVMDIVMEDPIVPDLTRPVNKSVKDEASGKLRKVTEPARFFVEEAMTKRNSGTPDDLIGKRMSELSYGDQALLIRVMSQAGYFTPDDKKLSYETVNKAGKPIRKFVGWPSGDVHTAKAIKILRTDPESVPDIIDSALQGMKVRSFYNNLAFGSEQFRGDITMDTHAMSAAVGRKFSSKSRQKTVFFGGPPSSAEYGFRGFYPIFADAYRDVAEEYGIEPHHFQALIWLQWRHEQDNMPIIVHSALEAR